MQICEYFFENACYSVTKYYLCKQNNKRSLLGRKQQSQVARSFPNRYLFSYTNKVTSLFSISCILDIILVSKIDCFAVQYSLFSWFRATTYRWLLCSDAWIVVGSVTGKRGLSTCSSWMICVMRCTISGCSAATSWSSCRSLDRS